MSVLPKLKKGDRVALVDASGPVPEDRLEQAVSAVRSFGLEPVLYESCTARHGYLAGPDPLRARDLQAAFEDPEIRGVLSIRGGYGAHRILPLLDLDSIEKNWKFFLGYSDVTALHIAFNNRGLVSCHSPMPSTEWYSSNFDDFTRARVEEILFSHPTTLMNPPAAPAHCLQEGVAEGRLVGGNLSLVSASIGTPWSIDAKDKILFLEDINEDVYRVDNMLTHLRNAGIFDACKGVILGAWTDCSAKDPKKSLTLRQVFEELIMPAGKPVLMDFCCGHCLPTLCLPLGEMVRLDAGSKRVDCLEE